MELLAPGGATGKFQYLQFADMQMVDTLRATLNCLSRRRFQPDGKLRMAFVGSQQAVHAGANRAFLTQWGGQTQVDVVVVWKSNDTLSETDSRGL